LKTKFLKYLLFPASGFLSLKLRWDFGVSQ